MAVNSVEEFSIAVKCIGARRRKVREIFFFFLSFLDCDIYFLPYHILHCQCQLLCTTCWLCHSSFRSLHAPDRVRSFYFLHTPSTWGELLLKVYWLELDWVWERVAQVDVYDYRVDYSINMRLILSSILTYTSFALFMSKYDILSCFSVWTEGLGGEHLKSCSEKKLNHLHESNLARTFTFTCVNFFSLFPLEHFTETSNNYRKMKN